MIDDDLDQDAVTAIFSVADQRRFLERQLEQHGPRTARLRAAAGFDFAEQHLREHFPREAARADQLLARNDARRAAAAQPERTP